jgi:uncharacterized protein (TIGR02421 family)
MSDSADRADDLLEDGVRIPRIDREGPEPAAEDDGDWRAPEERPWRSYKERIADIAEQIVEAQRPIRVLQSLRWEPAVEEAFRRSGAREMPRVGPEDYARNELGFDPRAKAEEFEGLMRAVERQLGPDDAIGRILLTTAYEYRQVVRMLAARGTRDFYVLSKSLYGSPKDRLPDGKTTVRELGQAIYETLGAISSTELGLEQPRDIGAQQAAELLNARFAAYFETPAIQVQVDDTLLADAAAGGDYVKIRSGARFSQRDVDLLEVHEGWVHIATSLNGQNQPVARWLAKGPPRTAAVQEGLAAIVELLTYRSYPKRARKLNDRILAVDKAEDGASFLDVYEWYRTEGYDDEESYANTRRVFRGGLTDGGAPFTKDACYCKGLVLNFAFIRAAVQNRRADLVPYLFVGKVAHEDIPVLHAKVAEGIVRPPLYLPPMFRDLNGLAIWTAYSSFFFRMGSAAVDDYYTALFRRAEG